MNYVEDNGISEIFFKTTGRLNRWRYFKRRFVLGVLLTMLLTLGYRVLGYEYGQVTTSAAVYNAIISIIFIVPTAHIETFLALIIDNISVSIFIGKQFLRLHRQISLLL